MPPPHTLIRGSVNTTAGSTAIYTNNSGAPQAIAVWDVMLALSAVGGSAGVLSAVTTQIQIDGVTVLQNELDIWSQSSDAMCATHDLGGAQFLLLNTHTIVIACANVNSIFWRVNASLAVDIYVGSP